MTDSDSFFTDSDSFNIRSRESENSWESESGVGKFSERVGSRSRESENLKSRESESGVEKFKESESGVAKNF